MVSLRSQLQQRVQLSPLGQRWQQLPPRAYRSVQSDP